MDRYRPRCSLITRMLVHKDVSEQRGVSISSAHLSIEESEAVFICMQMLFHKYHFI